MLRRLRDASFGRALTETLVFGCVGVAIEVVFTALTAPRCAESRSLQGHS